LIRRRDIPREWACLRTGRVVIAGRYTCLPQACTGRKIAQAGLSMGKIELATASP